MGCEEVRPLVMAYGWIASAALIEVPSHLHLQFDGDQAIQPAMQEQKIQGKSSITDLKVGFRAHEAFG